MKAGSTIWWTWEVEDAFQNVQLGDKNAMKKFSVKLSNQLNDLVAMVRSDLTNLIRKKVSVLTFKLHPCFTSSQNSCSVLHIHLVLLCY